MKMSGTKTKEKYLHYLSDLFPRLIYSFTGVATLTFVISVSLERNIGNCTLSRTRRVAPLVKNWSELTSYKI